MAKYLPDSSVVSINIRVLSGLSNEGKYAGSGISHLIEHLIFKGTSDKNSEELRKEIKEIGGIINAGTGIDSAEYYITVPRENFEKAFYLLSRMVMELVFTEEDFNKEKDVILNEMNLRNDDPMIRQIKELFSRSYTLNVYKYPIIGYKESLLKLTIEDLHNYHASAYTPDRMVVAVVGGVEEKKALDIVGSAMSKHEREKLWPTDVYEEPVQIDKREAEIPADIVLGYLALGFHTTSLYSEDLYSTDVLSILLGEGEDSRIYKRLVKEKELLYSVGSSNYTPRYPGLFVITGVGDPEKLDEARKEIFSVIEELKSAKLDEAELSRAKNIVVSGYVHSQEGVTNMASSVTNSYILTGDPHFHEKYVDEIKKVNLIRVQEAANKYLKEDNSTTIKMLPKFFVKKNENLQTAQEKDAKFSGEEKFFTLANGVRLVIKERPRLPIVTVTLASRGGVLAETKENNGISNITAALLVKGTKTRSEREIVPVFEAMGGNLSPFSGMNSFGLSMNVLSKDLDKGLDIFEDVIKNPVFPETEISKEKKLILAAIKEQDDDIFDNGVKNLKKLLYAEHPYSMDTAGTEETVSKISQKDIKKFYSNNMILQETVITVVGDVNAEMIFKNISKRFSNLAGKKGSSQKSAAMSPLVGSNRKDVDMKKEQALLLMGFRGVTLKDGRKDALLVLSSILSGSDGILFYSLREKEGLVYTSGSGAVPAVDPGYFIIYAATTEENLAKTESLILDAIKKVQKGDFGNEEIESSKAANLTGYALSLERNSSISMILTLDELYGLGYDDYKSYPEKLKKVTKDDVAKVANEILDLKNYVTIIVHSKK